MLGSRSPCDGCRAAPRAARAARLLRAHSRLSVQAQRCQNSSVSITLCIHGPIETPPVLPAPPTLVDRRGGRCRTHRPVAAARAIDAADPTPGPARPRPSDGPHGSATTQETCFTPVDADRCVVRVPVEDASTPPARACRPRPGHDVAERRNADERSTLERPGQVRPPRHGPLRRLRDGRAGDHAHARAVAREDRQRGHSYWTRAFRRSRRCCSSATQETRAGVAARNGAAGLAHGLGVGPPCFA